MAQVGQTTQTGSREFSIYTQQAAGRVVTVPTAFTVNHIGSWIREQTTANQNVTKAAIYAVSDTNLKQMTNEVAATMSTSFGLRQHNFADNATVYPAGDYILFVAASPGTSGVGVVSGQNGPGGQIVSFFTDPAFYPTFPSSYSGLTENTATRLWDLYLDYTAVTVATLSSPTPSGTLGTTTTATIGATTDQATGNFYVVVDSSANLTGVTATQIKAGQRADGAAALAHNDSAVGSTTPSAGVTGLVAGTSYAYAAIQNNANGDSNIVTGTFTTASSGTTSSGGSGGARARVATLMLS